MYYNISKGGNMKKFKLVSDIMVFIAISLFALSIIISSISTSTYDQIFLALVEVNLIVLACAIVGVFLIFSKNEVAKKLGHGLTVLGFVAGLVCALAVLRAISDASTTVPDPDFIRASSTTTESTFSICAVFMIVAVVFLALHYAFLLVDCLFTRKCADTDPKNDVRIVRIKEWKALLEEGIISEEEYEKKRAQLLDIKPNRE